MSAARPASARTRSARLRWSRARPARRPRRERDVPVLAYFRGDDGYIARPRRRRDRQAARGRHGRAARSAGGCRLPRPTPRAIGDAGRDGAAVRRRHGRRRRRSRAAPPRPRPTARRSRRRSATVAPGQRARVHRAGRRAGRRRSAALQGLEAAVLKAGGEARGVQGAQGRRARRLDRRPAPRSARCSSSRARRRSSPGGSAGSSARATSTASGRARSPSASSTSSRSTGRTTPVTEDDVRALVAEVVPDSTWAFLDAVAERRVDRSPAPLLDRLLETTPEPVITVQLHRRLRELLDRRRPHLAAGPARRTSCKAIGVTSVPGAEAGRAGAARGRLDELEDALEGVLDLDAMVKGAPDAGRPTAQRRLAFASGSRDRVAPAALTASAAGPRESKRRRSRDADAVTGDGPSVGGGPGLLLEHHVALDGEHAAARRTGRAARSAPGRCTAGGSPRTARPGSRSTAARIRSGSRKVVSKRVMMSRRLQLGQRSRRPDIGSSPGWRRPHWPTT